MRRPRKLTMRGKRAKVSRSKSGKLFRKTAAPKARNIRRTSMRGGIRL